MQSVYQAATNTDPLAVGDSPASCSQSILQEVLRVSREWLERLHVPSKERAAVQHLASLAEDLVGDAHASPLAMAQVRALLCGSCHHLNAAHGQCSGQSLERCPLLQESQR
jgi:hypothetical protein